LKESCLLVLCAALVIAATRAEVGLFLQNVAEDFERAVYFTEDNTQFDQ
jgi:hypothetical protein